MNAFTASQFFDLSNFEHSSIFSSSEHVWKALEQLKNYLESKKLGKIEITIPEGVYLVNPHLISIAEGTVIEPGAYIQGPCILGKGCSVRHGAYIRGNVIAGDGCVIGHDTEIKHSILLNKAHAAHFAYVGDSIIGNRVNLGAGVKCANFKFDGSSIVVRSGEISIPTGMRKLGSVLGDDVQIGCNTVLNPGSLVGKNAWCYPAINIGGVIPEASIVKSNVQTVILSK